MRYHSILLIFLLGQWKNELLFIFPYESKNAKQKDFGREMRPWIILRQGRLKQSPESIKYGKETENQPDKANDGKFIQESNFWHGT